MLLRDAAAWTVHLLASDDVSVSNVRILNDRHNLNTDGIDPDLSSRVRIDRAFVYTKDDAVCVKASGNGGFGGDVHDVRVTNSVLSSRDAALKVGTESSAERFEDVTFEDCTVLEWAGRCRSWCATERCTTGSRSGGSTRPWGGPPGRAGHRRPGPRRRIRGHPGPVVRGRRRARLRAAGSAWTWYAQFGPAGRIPATPVAVFEGADDVHRVDGLRLRNVVVGGTRLTDLDTARDVAGLTVGPFVSRVDVG